MIKTATALRFRACRTPSRDELIADGAISRCTIEALAWLETLATPSLTQAGYRDVLLAQITAAQEAAVARCLAGDSVPDTAASAPGVSIHVACQSPAGLATASPASQTSALAARLALSFSPGSSSNDCPPLSYALFHQPVLGGNTYLSATVLTPPGAPPALNGIGEYANTLVWDDADWTRSWADVVYRSFSRGNWGVSNPKVFDAYADWRLSASPPPELLARAAFDPSLQQITLPGFPAEGAPTWTLVHRYQHLDSGTSFWFVQSVIAYQGWNPVGTSGGYGYSGSFYWRSFVAPEDGVWFDPAGTWTHETGVVDFSMSNVEMALSYDGELMATGQRTITPIGDPGSAAFVGSAAGFSETVKLATIGPYKAAFRIEGVDAVPGIGVRLSLRLINDFPFSACIAVAVPCRSGPVPVVIRNLLAYQQSSTVSLLLPLANLDGEAGVDLQTYSARIANIGFVGRALWSSFPDGTYLSSVPTAGMVIADDGQTADAWGCYTSNGERLWVKPGYSPSLGAAALYACAADAGATLGSDYSETLEIEVTVRGEKNCVGGISRYDFPWAQIEVPYACPRYPAYAPPPWDFVPRQCWYSWELNEALKNIMPIVLTEYWAELTICDPLACSFTRELKTIVTSRVYEVVSSGSYYEKFLIYGYDSAGVPPYEPLVVYRDTPDVYHETVWNVREAMNEINLRGQAEYEAAKASGNWWFYFEKPVKLSISRTDFIERYGARINFPASAADGHGVMTRVGEWDTAADLEEFLTDKIKKEFTEGPDHELYRNLTYEVTKHPVLSVARTPLAEDDYPSGIPPNPEPGVPTGDPADTPISVDGLIHPLLNNSSSVITAVWA